MPVSLPQKNKHIDDDMVQPIFRDSAMLHWLAALINERHDRNWSKINRFVQIIRETISSTISERFDECILDDNCIDYVVDVVDEERNLKGIFESPHEDAEFSLPRSYDVVGDVAIVHESFSTASTNKTRSMHEWEKVGELLMQKNKFIKVVALQNKNLQGTERAPSELVTVAGAQRSPLITTHGEYGIKCVVDLNQTFFTPRMAQERLRICQQVARGEHVLVLFAGVAMEALQIAGRTEAASVTSVELNPVAVECAKRAHRMLERNKAVKCKGAADRLVILEGDVLQILPTLPKHHYDRILAPRPKEGSMDGDIGTGDGGLSFLIELLAVLKRNGGECHWYDFVADHEYPDCERSKRLIEGASRAQGLDVDFLHVARVGSVAMRQLRVCIDFRIKNSTATSTTSPS
jgi:tRNA G37 N-methylase Trm5